MNERRAYFRPEIWGDGRRGQTIHQTWFPGFHSDVGGCNDNENDIRRLTLLWMMDKLRMFVAFDEHTALDELTETNTRMPGRFKDMSQRSIYQLQDTVPRNIAPRSGAERSAAPGEKASENDGDEKIMDLMMSDRSAARIHWSLQPCITALLESPSEGMSFSNSLQRHPLLNSYYWKNDQGEMLEEEVLIGNLQHL